MNRFLDVRCVPLSRGGTGYYLCHLCCVLVFENGPQYRPSFPAPDFVGTFRNENVESGHLVVLRLRELCLVTNGILCKFSRQIRSIDSVSGRRFSNDRPIEHVSKTMPETDPSPTPAAAYANAFLSVGTSLMRLISYTTA